MVISSQEFAKVIGRYFPKGVPPSVIALSGGVDSMCLTYLLSQHKRLYQPDMKLLAVTVDHAYRKDSDQEAINVGKAIKSWDNDIKHEIARLTYNQPINTITNFEEVARLKRYDTFKSFCTQYSISNIFLAHNFNDQIETYLYRLLAGSTLLGLQGLKPVSMVATDSTDDLPSKLLREAKLQPSSASLVRPLLEFEKSDIIETCKNANVEWFEDPSNKDSSLTIRNRLRSYIQEYVPTNLDKNPNLECITSPNLKKTHDKITELNEYITTQAIALEKQLKKSDRLHLDEDMSTLKIVLTYDEMEANSDRVLARLLYGNTYPITITSFYHWKYAKFERQAIPKIVQSYHRFKKSDKKNVHTERLSYVNALFDVTFDDLTRSVIIEVYREPAKPKELYKIEKELVSEDLLGQWCFWDSRYWIKVGVEPNTNTKTAENGAPADELEIESVLVTPYDHQKHLKLFKSLKIEINLKQLKLRQDPIVIATFKEKYIYETADSANNGGKAALDPKYISVALPTRNIYSDDRLFIDYSLKENLYKLEQMKTVIPTDGVHRLPPVISNEFD